MEPVSILRSNETCVICSSICYYKKTAKQGGNLQSFLSGPFFCWCCLVMIFSNLFAFDYLGNKSSGVPSSFPTTGQKIIESFMKRAQGRGLEVVAIISYCSRKVYDSLHKIFMWRKSSLLTDLFLKFSKQVLRPSDETFLP